MSKIVISAGFLIKSTNDKYLIVKPTGGTTKGWGIPKGKRDPGELILDAAIRETYEETGLKVTDHTNEIEYEAEPFFHYKVETTEGGSKKKFVKDVFVFRAYATTKIEEYPFECKSFLGDVPEIDAFEWVTLEEAHERVVKSQKGIFAFLLNYKQLSNET